MSYFPKPVTKQCTERILAQMNNSFFEIKGNENDINICYFCKIEYKNKNIIVLIINKYLIDLEFTNSIFISINNKFKRIQFGRTRFRDKNLDLSIIEIELNEIENVNFLEMDDKSYEKEPEMFYNKENIYIIQMDNKKDASVSYGILNDIHNKHIYYSCNLSQNYKCFYLFNSSNNKIIGINNHDKKNSNRGIFMKYLINKFFSYINKISKLKMK